MTGGAPTLGYVIHYVADVRRTVAFYEAAFGLGVRFVDDDGDFAMMETGATALAFCGEALVKDMGLVYRPTRLADPPPAMEIALLSADVPAAYGRAVAAGAIPVLEPQTKPWGQTVAYVRDADGALVELCTAMG